VSVNESTSVLEASNPTIIIITSIILVIINIITLKPSPTVLEARNSSSSDWSGNGMARLSPAVLPPKEMGGLEFQEALFGHCRHVESETVRKKASRRSLVFTYFLCSVAVELVLEIVGACSGQAKNALSMVLNWPLVFHWWRI
jgi:hypothetical protein